MLRIDPSKVDWNTRYSYSYKCFPEKSNEERYGLRSTGNATVMILTKAEWNELGELFEKAWPVIQRAARLTTVDSPA
jgi:hypothetical protein